MSGTSERAPNLFFVSNPVRVCQANLVALSFSPLTGGKSFNFGFLVSFCDRPFSGRIEPIRQSLSS